MLISYLCTYKTHNYVNENKGFPKFKFFLEVSVTFFDFNGNFNGKMAKNRFSAIKSARNALQPSS